MDPTTDPAPSEEPAGVTRFRAALERAGSQGQVVLLPRSVSTAALAAEALGCDVGAIANSLLFDSAGQPVLILTSGAHRVDTDKVATMLGLPPLRRAAPDFVRSATGQVVGGVSPLGHPHPIPTYLDTALRQFSRVWAAAGHPRAVFETTYEELRSLTAAREIKVA